MKAQDPELAVAWRKATREALASRLDGGWEVQDLVRSTEALSYYLLRTARESVEPAEPDPAYVRGSTG
jgi:predicted GNAT superfamily acetyltransferase